MKKYYFILLMSVLLNSCYKEMDLEKYRNDPIIVLNGVIASDTIVAGLSRSWFFTDGNPDTRIEGGNIELRVNQERKGILEFMPAVGAYASGLRVKKGDIVEMIATTPDNQVVSGIDTVPSKVEIKEVNTSILQIADDFGNSTEITYYITFEDPLEEENYYFIRIEGGGFGVGIVNFSVDPVFISQSKPMDGVQNKDEGYAREGRTFTDESINGKEYVMTIKETEMAPGMFYDDIQLHPERAQRTIMLYSLSKTYYKYLKSIELIGDSEASQTLTDLGLTEPTEAFSNIKGGVGIVGACQTSTVVLKLEDILKSAD